MQSLAAMTVHTTKYRALLFLSGFALCSLAGFAFLHLVSARPLAPLCILASALVFLFGICCFVVSRRDRSVGLAVFLGIASTPLFCFILSPFLPAAVHAWTKTCRHEVRSVLADIDNAASYKDRYGGQYHVRPVSTNAWIVYSDGPDHRDDGGKNQIAHKVGDFEWAFAQIYPPPVSFLIDGVKAAALWEVTRLWHSFGGDIVWSCNENSLDIDESQPRGGG